jgi:hypothetical protein
MKTPSGDWQKPPPPWTCIFIEGECNESIYPATHGRLKIFSTIFVLVEKAIKTFVIDVLLLKSIEK